MAERKDGGWSVAASPADTVRRRSREGPDGVRFVEIGNADASERTSSCGARPSGAVVGHVAFNTVVRTLADKGGWVVVDLQGGTVQVAGVRFSGPSRTS